MKKLNGINYIKATDLSRGKAANCLKKVHESNEDTIVLKNSEPYVSIISIERYELLIEAMERLEEYQNLLECKESDCAK